MDKINMKNKSRFVVFVEIKEQILVGGEQGDWIDKEDGYSSWARLAEMATSKEADELFNLLHDRSNDLLDWNNPQKEFDILKK